MFNSTSPRFNYEKMDAVNKEIPGPGSYNSTNNKTFQTSIKSAANNNNQQDKASMFKDTTVRMDDAKGDRGF